MADDHPQREGLSKTLMTFLALVPAIATAITGFLAWQVSSEVESVRAELERIENQRAFDLEIYKAVKEALKGDTRDQQVALALVVSIGQDPLKAALLETLEEAPSAAPEIVAQARGYRMPEEAASQPQADADAPPAARGAPAWADWDFDLFYCEGSPPLGEDPGGRAGQRHGGGRCERPHPGAAAVGRQEPGAGLPD